MKAIGYVVRAGAGNVMRSEISADGAPTAIYAGSGQEISLNLRQMDIQGYQRLGDNLQITLADGRVIILEEFYGAGDAARLFISADGYISEVALVEGAEGAVYASYGPTEEWGKWSPSDELIFLDNTDVAHAAVAQEDEVSMLGAGLLAGALSPGLLGAGAAAVGATALLGGGGGGGGGGAVPRVAPTVDQDGTITVAGDDITEADQAILISGTAEPGSDVVVSIGGNEISTVASGEGTWELVFEGDDFPADGSYDVAVVVTEQDGTVTELAGPGLVVDLTGPEISFSDGTQSAGDMTNAADYADGVEIGGAGEPGATIAVTIDGVTHETVVDQSGSWGVVFAPGELAEGEYETQVTVVSADQYGNSTTVTDTVVIDTVAGVTISTGQVGGDNLINGSEAENGVTLIGTAEPGATVEVTLDGTTHGATVDENGSWSVDFAPGEVPTGEREVEVIAVATDEAGNSSTTTGTLQVDTVNSVSFDADAVEGDGVVNAVEHADGVILTGMTQPGASVSVTMNGVTKTATVAADGGWSADFAAAEIPTGEYGAQVSVRSTDAAGNIATTGGTVRIDTENMVSFVQGPGGSDGVINAAEAGAGVTVTGQTAPGSSVVVSLGGASHPATVAADGSWSANFSAGEIPQGEYDAVLTATSTDAAGNVSTATDTVRVDTAVQNMGFAGGAIEGDNVINAAERSDGVPVSGTVEPGSTVTVSMGGVSRAATVDADGNWTATFAPGDIPTGEYQATVTALATDRAGNTETISQTVEVDTLVNQLANSGAPVEGDNVVNAAEAADGFALSGQVEPGSSVTVSFGGEVITATVDAAGNWTASIPASAIASGEYDASAVIDATDAAGNTASITRTIAIDTTAPEGPVVESYTRGLAGYTAISTDMTDDEMAVYEVDNASGGVSQIAAEGDGVDIPILGTTTFGFSPAVPDGSHLVVTSTDDAGNTSGTYLVLDETSTSVVNMGNDNLGALQIEAIDLQFAEDSQLTISEAQLTALSGNSDTVTIHGGSDDTVTITGAQATGQSIDVAGQSHDIYTLGDTGQLIIDEDITVVI